MSNFEPPRAPLFSDKSGSVDMPDGYERKMADFRVASREEALRTYRYNQEAGDAAKYIRAICGDQWGPNARRWRSRFVDNRLAKSRMDHLAKLTDIRPVIDVDTQVDAYKDVAAVISALIRYEWNAKDIDMKLVGVADIADTYGTGFWRLGAAKPGNMFVTPCGPDMVMPIQPGMDIQESTGVRYRTWKSVQWLKQKFPYSTANIEREIMSPTQYGVNNNSYNDINFNRPQHIDELTWNGLAIGMKRLVGVKGQPTQDAMTGEYYKSMEVEEFFIDDLTCNNSTQEVLVKDPFLTQDQHNWWYKVKPGQRLFPRKRHMVFAGSRLLADGPSPYWHGLYPFATLRFNPVFWSFWGMSRYRDLLPLNQAMNQIVAACLDLIKRALNPTALTKENAIPSAAWQAFYPDMPGYKLRVNANQDLKDSLRYMDPPVIPQYVVQMLTGWLAPEFDRMTGGIDIQQLQGKNQNPGGDTIEAMRDSLETSMRLEERMLEIFLRDAGVQAASNIIQFSTIEDRLKKLGASGITGQDFNVDIGSLLPEDKNEYSKFISNFSFNISAGSLHSGAKDRSKQVAITLASRGLFPVQELYKVLEIPNADQVYSELVKELAAKAQMMDPAANDATQLDGRMTRGQRNSAAT